MIKKGGNVKKTFAVYLWHPSFMCIYLSRSEGEQMQTTGELQGFSQGHLFKDSDNGRRKHSRQGSNHNPDFKMSLIFVLSN